MHPRFAKHFRADEHEDDGQPFVEIAEIGQDSGQQEIKGAQAQNRADIRGIDQERVARDAEYGGDRVEGKNQIRRFEHEDDKKQRRRQPPAVFPHEQFLPGASLRHRQNLLRPPHHRIFLRVHGMVRAEQFESGVQQERSEKVENPIEALNQDGPDADHRAAQDERAQHSPKQQAVLIAGIDAKKLEDQQEEKNVVHAERFFNHVAREKFQAGPAPVRKENPESKPDGKRDPDRAFQRGFAQGDHVRAPVKQAEVQQQKERNPGVEGDPERPGAHLGRARFSGNHRWRNPQWSEF